MKNHSRNSPLVLLIDGNNLAHHLYPHLTARHKMTQEDSLRLVNHLISYQRTYAGQVTIELFLDRMTGDLPVQDDVRTHSADHPDDADSMLLGHFWYCHQASIPYLVVSNDGRILDEVRDAGGEAMLVYDFVRRAGSRKPVFREPAGLIQNISTQARIEEEPESTVSVRITSEHAAPRKPLAARRLPNRPEKTIKSKPAAVTDQAQTIREGVAGTPSEQANIEPDATSSAAPEPAAAGSPGPACRLTLDTWPAVPGIHFLLDSFCKVHRSQAEELVNILDLEAPTSKDVSDLAELLLSLCGEEADFITRQGSLLDHARLALLQADGYTLPLAEIARRTGRKITGLQGQMRRKAGGWFVFEENQRR